MPEYCKVIRRMTLSYPAFIFPECYVKCPVQTLPNTPMIPNGIAKTNSRIGKNALVNYFIKATELKK